MSPFTQVRALPRTIIDTTLTAVRLPLTAAERVAGQTGNEEWPPAMAFEGAEATVETVLGGLFRDDELVRRGRLRQAKLAELREATQLKTVAEQKRQGADAKLQERLETDEQRRERLAENAQRQQEQLDQQAQKQKNEVERKANQRKQAARKQAAATEKRLDGQERNAKLAAASAETEALTAQRQALAAEDTAERLDDAVEAARQERKSS